MLAVSLASLSLTSSGSSDERRLQLSLPLLTIPCTHYPLYFSEKYLTTKKEVKTTNVADPGCLSRILIFVHLGSWISPDPKTATKEKGGNKFVVLPFCNQKYHETKNYFIFEQVKKNFGPIYKKL
jgi:hypothetical protein